MNCRGATNLGELKKENQPGGNKKPFLLATSSKRIAAGAYRNWDLKNPSAMSRDYNLPNNYL